MAATANSMLPLGAMLAIFPLLPEEKQDTYLKTFHSQVEKNKIGSEIQWSNLVTVDLGNLPLSSTIQKIFALSCALYAQDSGSAEKELLDVIETIALPHLATLPFIITLGEEQVDYVASIVHIAVSRRHNNLVLQLKELWKEYPYGIEVSVSTGGDFSNISDVGFNRFPVLPGSKQILSAKIFFNSLAKPGISKSNLPLYTPGMGIGYFEEFDGLPPLAFATDDLTIQSLKQCPVSINESCYGSPDAFTYAMWEAKTDLLFSIWKLFPEIREKYPIKSLINVAIDFCEDTHDLRDVMRTIIEQIGPWEGNLQMVEYLFISDEKGNTPISNICKKFRKKELSPILSLLKEYDLDNDFTSTKTRKK